MIGRTDKQTMKRCSDEDDAAAAALAVRAKLMRGSASAAPVSTSAAAGPASTSAAAAPASTSAASSKGTSHASLFAKPSSLFKKPKRENAAPPPVVAAPASSTAPHSCTSDAAHAAAIFGSARKKAAPTTEEKAAAAEDSATAARAADAFLASLGAPSDAPLFQVLRVGSECLAQYDGTWRRCRVTATVHAGFENARFKVVPLFGGADAPPREFGVDRLRAVTTDAARLARGRCTFFDAGECSRGDRCPFAHEGL